MKLQFLVTCVFAVANAGYINSNYPVYNAIEDTAPYKQNSANFQGSSYVQSSVPHGSSFAPSGSFAQENPYYQHISNSYISGEHDEYIPEIKDGVPVDTPEVQRAKAEHFALFAKAAAAAAKASAQHSGQVYYQPKNTQTYYHTASNQYEGDYNNGYNYQSNSLSNSDVQTPHQYIQTGPVDTPEVQHAKAAHFVAYAKAAARTAPNKHYRYRRGLDYSLISNNLFNSQSQHVPIITKEGVPVETPEVQAAKAQHLLAHANARSGHSEWRQVGNYASSAQGWNSHGTPQVNHVQYSINHQNTYGGWQSYQHQHIPLLDKHGVPIETPEVQAAKQQHFLAHAQAKSSGLNQGWQQYSGSSFGGSSLAHQGTLVTPHGVPEETPEVKIAKAQHLAAHAQEQAKHSQWAGQSDFGDEYSYGGNSYTSHY